MEASSRATEASGRSGDGESTGGRASAQLDAAHTAPLPAPDSYTNGHSMQEPDGSLDEQAHAVTSPVRQPEAAAIYPQVAAQALAPSAPGPLLAMLTPEHASAQQPPSLGVLSTQEHPARRPAASDAAPRSVLYHSPAADAEGKQPSDVEVPAKDARTPAPPPALGAPESPSAGQAAAPAEEPPVSMPAAVDARTPGAVPAEGSAPASAGAAAEQVDITGQLTPGTVSALADLLSGVSINAAATPPSATRKQDAAVGLVYDEAMERHWGPASAVSAHF